MNDVLREHLASLGLDPDVPPSTPAKWRRLLEMIGADYEEAERHREMLEDSVRTSAREIEDMSATFQARADDEVTRRETHFRTLLSLLPVATFQEDFTAVGRWLESLRVAGVSDLGRYLAEHPEAVAHGAGLVEVLEVNAAALELLRRDDARGLVGRTPAGSRDSTSMASYIPQFEAVWNGSAHTRFEYDGHRSDGEPFYGILHWSAPSTAEGLDLGRVVVSITDITARRLAEQQMEELVRSKDDFLASVSHEIRTPLTTVYGSAEALLDQWDHLEADVQRELVGLIARESGELSHMVEDLLVAAQADLGTVSIVPQETELAEIVERIGDATETSPNQVLEIAAVEASAWVDPLRTTQIVRNLFTNAVRYGGDRIVVRASVLDDRCVLTVADNGAGVPEARREAIFDLYERGQPESGLAGSVGVGLAVSRSLARMMGGELDYSHEDGWSTFRLDVPATARTRSSLGGSGFTVG